MLHVSTITKNRTLVDKWLRHEFNEGSGYFEGNFSVGFFVAEEYYAAFREDLEAEFDSVSAMGEVAGTPSGKITNRMRQMGNKLWGHPEADEAL